MATWDAVSVMPQVVATGRPAFQASSRRGRDAAAPPTRTQRRVAGTRLPPSRPSMRRNMTGTTARWLTSSATMACATAPASNDGRSQTEDPVITARTMSDRPPMCPGDRHNPQRSPAVRRSRRATAAAEAARARRLKPKAMGGPEEPDVRMSTLVSGKWERP